MIRYLLLGWLGLSAAAVGASVIVAAGAGLADLGRMVRGRLRPRPHVDLDQDQREMLEELERLWKRPAFRGGRV